MVSIIWNKSAQVIIQIFKGSFLINFHRLQVKIAQRGVELLKVGGTMTYSTCSLNPLENEAVVIEILRRSQGKLMYSINFYFMLIVGAVSLVDVSTKLPELKRSPGMKSWKVCDASN